MRCSVGLKVPLYTVFLGFSDWRGRYRYDVFFSGFAVIFAAALPDFHVLGVAMA
jgi:hypothetical protein